MGGKNVVISCDYFPKGDCDPGQGEAYLPDQGHGPFKIVLPVGWTTERHGTEYIFYCPKCSVERLDRRNDKPKEGGD